MSIQLELDSKTEADVAAAARREGVDTPTLIRGLIDNYLQISVAPDSENRRLIEQLRSWHDEDETDVQSELENRDSTTHQLLSSLALSRTTIEFEN